MDSIDYADPTTINGLTLYAYCNNNPVMYVDPTGHEFISLLIGLAISILITTAVSAVSGQHAATGVGLTAGGLQSVLTGFSLFGYGPIGWILGGTAIIFGIGSIIFGSAELQQGTTGGNWIKDAGLSDGWYNGLMWTTSTLATVASVAGCLFMNYANTSGTTGVGIKSKPFSRYALMDDQGVKQYRYFDSHGNALYDKDIRHKPGRGVAFPHYHGWENGKRTDYHWSFWQLLKWLF